ncbi:oligosaccharide repeat unit polymerase [Rhodococcus hoagii]|uniref:oligosaccharide repeat unit polymerase n=1 Tax=Rhodococcus hoagii TaxID=43767 RepID=UPI001EECCC1E|nr:oligosaccharide repeat unit polymerase [Prescottella equi]MBM4598886.1 oligosaccharide repeat unit polymerase [Prescottella equi]
MLIGAGMFVDNDTFERWRVPKYVDGNLTVLAAVPAVFFLVGIAIPMIRYLPRKELTVWLGPRTIDTCSKAATVTFWLAVAGSALWLIFAIRQGAGFAQFKAVLDFEANSVGNLKRISGPVAGLTTLTQFGPIAVCLRMLLVRSGLRDNRYQLYVLVALGLARAFFYGERLAIIELALPIIVVLVTVSRFESSRRALSGAILPVFAVPALWAVFAVFEYSRSWLYYRSVSDVPFVTYISERLLGYYVTSINNGSLYYLNASGYPHDPIYSFAALWDSPIIGDILGRATIGTMEVRSWWAWLLETDANPEFNNTSTFLVTSADFGTVWASVYWLALGLAIGLIYTSLKKGRVFGILAYSVCFIGILECVRITYWMQGRFTPVAIGLVILYFLFDSSRKRDEQGGAPT